MNGKEKNDDFRIIEGKVLKRGRYVVSSTSNLIKDILREFHDNVIGGYSSNERTIKRIKLVF